MFKINLVPSLIVIPSVIVMVMLGSWQLERLEWKEQFQKKIEKRQISEPIIESYYDNTLDDIEHRKITFLGYYLYEFEFHLVNRVYRGEAGINILTPFKISGAKKFILVNRGWAPLNYKNRAVTVGADGRKNIEITGSLYSIQEKAPLVPNNDSVNNTYFYIDPEKLGEVSGLSLDNKFYIKRSTMHNSVYPVGHSPWKKSSQKHHLFFAITWYSLSVLLSCMFITSHWQKN